jgi:outer membrane protein
MSRTRSPFPFGALAAALIVMLLAPAAQAADSTDIGFIDQQQLASLPQFQQANRQLNDFGANLQKQYLARARGKSPGEQQQLSAEFQQKIAAKQRELLGPLFGRAQVAIASVASSKNLSVVVDRRIVIVGGIDITGPVRDLLTGIGDPVPPVSTPPPSSVGFVDQAQIDALPKIKSATDDFAKFKGDQDRLMAAKLKAAKSDTDRNALMKDYQKTLQDKNTQMLKPLADKTRDAITDVARKRGLVLVVDRGDIIYGGTDITADVTNALK